MLLDSAGVVGGVSAANVEDGASLVVVGREEEAEDASLDELLRDHVVEDGDDAVSRDGDEGKTEETVEGLALKKHK